MLGWGCDPHPFFLLCLKIKNPYLQRLGWLGSKLGFGNSKVRCFASISRAGVAKLASPTIPPGSGKKESRARGQSQASPPFPQGRAVGFLVRKRASLAGAGLTPDTSPDTPILVPSSPRCSCMCSVHCNGPSPGAKFSRLPSLAFGGKSSSPAMYSYP